MPIDVLQHDDVVRIGRTWILDGTAPTADDGTIETLSAVQCEIRSEPGGLLLVTCSGTVSGAGGVWTVEAAFADTAQLVPGFAVYEVVATLTNGRRVTLVEGSLQIVRTATVWT
jgi:hypothetical protein